MKNDGAVLFDFAKKVYVATEIESAKVTCTVILNIFVTDRLEEESVRLKFISIPALKKWRSLISLHRDVNGSAEALLIVDKILQKNISYAVDTTVLEV